MISFGGRTLGDGQPKYVNGPETPLFSKRRTLYALDLAREGGAPRRRLVVVEGYMDVIALHQAGLRRRGGAAGHRADGRAAGRAVAPVAGAGPVLRRRCRRRPGRRARGADGAAAADAGPHHLPGHPAGGRGPRHAGAARRPGRLRRRAGRRAAAGPGAVRLCCAAPPATTPEAARRASARRLDAAAAASRTAAWPANTAAPCSTASSPRGAARRRQAAPAAPPRAARWMRTPAERRALLTAILLRHPDLLRDVEEAYGSLPLPAPLRSCATAILRIYITPTRLTLRPAEPPARIG